MAAWPIQKGTEPTTEHLEDLRQHIFKLERIGVEEEDDDYTSSNPAMIMPEDWVDYCTAFGVGEALAGERLLYDGEWFYLAADTTWDVLLSNPPTSGGTLNAAYWRYAVKYHRYHDYDHRPHNTPSDNRFIVLADTFQVDDGPNKRSIIDLPGYRFLPRTVDAALQREPIEYQDTQRRIPHRLPVEFARKYLTQPETLGPSFALSVRVAGMTPYVTKVVDEQDVGIHGGQYSLDGAQPGYAPDATTPALPKYKKLTDPPGDQGPQFRYCPKMNYAYQNFIEGAVSRGWWVLKVDPETPWGAEYIRNYNHSLIGKRTEPEEWDVGALYYNGDVVEYGGFWWRFKAIPFQPVPANSDTPPVYGSANWEYMATWGSMALNPDSGGAYPIVAYLDDEFWGCNGSAFELLLWVHGEYDWWFDTTLPYTPERIMLLQDAHGTEDYPAPVGTWRRTWRVSFGTPKNTTNMRPQELGDPSGQEYDGIDDVFWVGQYVGVMPDFELTEEEQALIDKRHHRVLATDNNPYEAVVQILNDMKAVLNLCRYHKGNVSAQMQFADSGAPTQHDHADPAIAFANALDAAEGRFPDSGWTSTPGVGYSGWHGTVEAIGGGLYRARGYYGNARVRLYNLDGAGLLVTQDVVVLLQTEYSHFVTYCSANDIDNPISIKIADDSLLVSPRCPTGPIAGNPWLNNTYFTYVTFPNVPDAEDDADEIFRHLVIDDTQPVGSAPTGSLCSIQKACLTRLVPASRSPQVCLLISLGLFPEWIFEPRPIKVTPVAVDSEKFDDDGRLKEF